MRLPDNQASKQSKAPSANLESCSRRTLGSISTLPGSTPIWIRAVVLVQQRLGLVWVASVLRTLHTAQAHKRFRFTSPRSYEAGTWPYPIQKPRLLIHVSVGIWMGTWDTATISSRNERHRSGTTQDTACLGFLAVRIFVGSAALALHSRTQRAMNERMNAAPATHSIEYLR